MHNFFKIYIYGERFLTALVLILVFKYLIRNYHVFNLLLILEIFMLLNLLLIINNQETVGLLFLILYFLFRVIEACVGLSLLIFVSRYIGEEYYEMYFN